MAKKKKKKKKTNKQKKNKSKKTQRTPNYAKINTLSGDFTCRNCASK